MESTIERKFKKYVESLGGRCFKLTCERGIPDRMVLLPGGVCAFAEIKQKSGRLSDIQKDTLQELHDLGHVIGVIWSEDDIEPFIARARSIYRSGAFEPCIKRNK